MADKIKPTDEAYPTHGGCTGMNLRTALAKDAMTGILAGRNTGILSKNEIDEITQKAVQLADKLIENLNSI